MLVDASVYTDVKGNNILSLCAFISKYMWCQMGPKIAEMKGTKCFKFLEFSRERLIRSVNTI